jgi:hypothetical protein
MSRGMRPCRSISFSSGSTRFREGMENTPFHSLQAMSSSISLCSNCGAVALFHLQSHSFSAAHRRASQLRKNEREATPSPAQVSFDVSFASSFSAPACHKFNFADDPQYW